MAKTQRLSNRGYGSPHLYCKPTKELITQIRTKHLLGIKSVIIKVPTFYNPTKKKRRGIYIGANSVLMGACSVTELNCKQGTEIEWEFNMVRFC